VRVVRVASALCSLALVLALCVLQAATPPSAIEAWYPEQGSLNREFLMVLCALGVIAWAYSVRLRCSSLATMRCLLAIAALLVFWLALTIVKWNVEDDRVVSIMWYLYYLPMLAVPTLVLASIVPQTAWSSSPRVRRVKAACWAVDGVFLAVVLTNNLHHAVFAFDFADSAWGSAYTYAPVYVVVYGWIVAQYLGFLAIAFVNARRDLRKSLAVIGLFFAVGAVYSVLYILRADLSLNLTVMQCLLVVSGLEFALELGILPSYARYGTLFQTVPYEVRVLDASGRVCAQSNAARPLPARLAERAVRAAEHSDGPVTLHLSQTPTVSYTVYAVLGGYALATKDVSALIDHRARLEAQRSQLKRRNRALSHQGELERALARQREEAQIADDIAATLAEKVARINGLLDALPDDPAQARGPLSRAKLLVSWCKQQGALVLGVEEGAQVAPAALRLALGQIASDMRGVGVECGTLVDVSLPLSARAAGVVYECLYGLAEAGCGLDDAVVMLYVRQVPATGDVRIRGVLQCADAGADALDQARERLASLRCFGPPPSVEREDATLRLDALVRGEGDS
jgi:hypothetical protein